MPAVISAGPRDPIVRRRRSAGVPLSGVSDQDRIVSAVKRTKSSVVAISEQVNGQQVIPADPFFQQFFGGQGPGIVQPYRGEASGSGFVIDRNGDIVTNAHVLQPPNGGKVTKLTVVFANGDRVPARAIAYNLAADVGLLRVDGYSKLPPPLELADSTKLEQGQWAIAIGEPLQLQQTVTVGVVSAFNRSEPIPTENGGAIDFKGLLQTSAPINPGNSGGPPIDIDGQVIGMNQSTVKSAYAQGIGFAIPSTRFAPSWPRFRSIRARTKAPTPASWESTWPTYRPASRTRSAIRATAASRCSKSSPARLPTKPASSRATSSCRPTGRASIRTSRSTTTSAPRSPATASASTSGRKG